MRGVPPPPQEVYTWKQLIEEIIELIGVQLDKKLQKEIIMATNNVSLIEKYVADQAYKEIREDNHPILVIAGRDIVVMQGHSVCPNNADLDGSAIWTAKVENEKVAEWRVYDDTPENRKLLNLR